MGGRGSRSSLSYQGRNGGSGKATGRGTIIETRQKIFKMLDKSPKVAEGQSEAISQIKSVASGDSTITMYRGAPSDKINPGDWVFLSKEKADAYTRSLFTKKKKQGYNTIEVKVKAKDIQWTGKNLEFMYSGKRSRRGALS